MCVQANAWHARALMHPYTSTNTQIQTPEQYMDLSGCFLLGDSVIPVALTACPALRSLKLEGCRKMTDAALGHVVKVSLCY